MSLFFGAEIKDLDRANACVLGVRWDQGSTFRSGSAMAPQKIRAYTSSKLYNSFTETGVNIKDHWSVYDFGDVDPASIEDAVARIKEAIGKQPSIELNIFFGGDHGITYATLRALTETSDSVWGLVYFDAHPDLYESYEGNPYSHACTVKRIIDDHIVNPQHIVQVGIRAATAAHLNYAKSNAISIFTTSDVCKKKPEAISSGITELLCDVDSVYVSFDIDVLDPAFAPGVGNPEGGGVTLRNLIDIVHGFEGMNIQAFDVVEVSPDYDYADITFFSVSKLIRETLGTLAHVPSDSS